MSRVPGSAVAAALLLAMLIAGGAAAATVPATPPVPRLEVEVAPGEHTVGDRVEVTLTLVTAAGRLAGEPRFPRWGESWGDAEVVAAGAPQPPAGDAVAGETALSQRVTLAAFRPGEVTLPPVTVAVPLTEGELELTTPAGLAFTVASVLPAGEAAPEPRPAAPPQPLPLGGAFLWTAAVALAAVLAAVAAALVTSRRQRAAAAAAAPPPPPFEELLAGLAAIGDAPSPAAGHTRLSRTLRRYLGRSLRFPATESSTSEIQRELLGRHLPGGAAQAVVGVLRDCDLVKFARRPCTAEQLAKRTAAARDVAESIELHLKPPQPVAAEEAA